MSDNAKRNKANARVRKHIPGGGEVLDLLNLVHKINGRQHASTEAGKITKTILESLDNIAHLMREKALEIHEATREKPDVFHQEYACIPTTTQGQHLSLTITKRADDFHCTTTGKNSELECGKTPAESIGKWLITHGADHGIVIHFQ